MALLLLIAIAVAVVLIVVNVSDESDQSGGDVQDDEGAAALVIPALNTRRNLCLSLDPPIGLGEWWSLLRDVFCGPGWLACVSGGGV